jgi:glycerol uptake facilitator protein
MHTSPFLGEFLGTMILILFGDGVVAGVLLKRSKAENAGWISITAAWGFAVTFGVFVSIACGGKDAFLNPAFTLGAAIASNDYSKLAIYWPAQFLGAFCGAVLVFLHYLPHWKETDNADFKLGIFCTGPAIRNTVANLISEIIGTFVLVFCAFTMSAKAIGAMSPGIGPYIVGILIWAIGLSLGGTTGYAINPARDLGPRIAHFVLPIPGKRDSDWAYAPIPVVGPLIGASLAGALIRFLAF